MQDTSKLTKTTRTEVAQIVKFDRENFQLIIDVPNKDIQKPVHRLAVEVPMDDMRALENFVNDTGLRRGSEIKGKVVNITMDTDQEVASSPLTLKSMQVASIEQTLKFSGDFQESQLPRQTLNKINNSLMSLDEKTNELLETEVSDRAVIGFVRVNENQVLPERIFGAELADFVKWKANPLLSEDAKYGLPASTYKGSEFANLRPSERFHVDTDNEKYYSTVDIHTIQSQKGDFYVEVGSWQQARETIVPNIEPRENRRVGTIMVDRTAIEKLLTRDANALPLFMDADGNIPEWRMEITNDKLTSKDDILEMADHAADNIAEYAGNIMADVVHQNLYLENFTYTFKSPIADVEMTDRAIEGTTRLNATTELYQEIDRHIKIADEKLDHERGRDVPSI